jgi:hypothetical protein
MILFVFAQGCWGFCVHGRSERACIFREMGRYDGRLWQLENVILGVESERKRRQVGQIHACAGQKSRQEGAVGELKWVASVAQSLRSAVPPKILARSQHPFPSTRLMPCRVAVHPVPLFHEPSMSRLATMYVRTFSINATQVQPRKLLITDRGGVPSRLGLRSLPFRFSCQLAECICLLFFFASPQTFLFLWRHSSKSWQALHLIHSPPLVASIVLRPLQVTSSAPLRPITMSNNGPEAPLGSKLPRLAPTACSTPVFRSID